MTLLSHPKFVGVIFQFGNYLYLILFLPTFPTCTDNREYTECQILSQELLLGNQCMIVVDLTKLQSNKITTYSKDHAVWQITTKVIFRNLVKRNTVRDWINGLNFSFLIFSTIFASEIPVLSSKKMKFISLHLDLRFWHVLCFNQQKWLCASCKPTCLRSYRYTFLIVITFNHLGNNHLASSIRQRIIK